MLSFGMLGPFEVESTLKLHPAVIESAVVASPDPTRDEIVKAFIVLTPTYSLLASSSPTAETSLIRELQEHCKKHAAPYKYPRKIEFVMEGGLPKTVSGKIRRVELKMLERRRYEEAKAREKVGKAKL